MLLAYQGESVDSETEIGEVANQTQAIAQILTDDDLEILNEGVLPHLRAKDRIEAVALAHHIEWLDGQIGHVEDGVNGHVLVVHFGQLGAVFLVGDNVDDDEIGGQSDAAQKST